MIRLILPLSILPRFRYPWRQVYGVGAQRLVAANFLNGFWVSLAILDLLAYLFLSRWSHKRRIFFSPSRVGRTNSMEAWHSLEGVVSVHYPLAWGYLYSNINT